MNNAYVYFKLIGSNIYMNVFEGHSIKDGYYIVDKILIGVKRKNGILTQPGEEIFLGNDASMIDFNSFRRQFIIMIMSEEYVFDGLTVFVNEDI